MGINSLRHSVLNGPKSVGEFGLGLGANVGYMAVSAARNRLDPYPTSLVATLFDKIDSLLVPGEAGLLTTGEKQVRALRTVHIANELHVAESAIKAAQHDVIQAAVAKAKPDKARTNRDREVIEREKIADEFARHYVLYAGTVVAKGILIPETEEFPYRTTADDLDGFIEVADLAYHDVKVQSTIDPPLRPVGYENEVFNTLHIATQQQFHPGTTILL